VKEEEEEEEEGGRRRSSSSPSRESRQGGWQRPLSSDGRSHCEEAAAVLDVATPPGKEALTGQESWTY